MLNTKSSAVVKAAMSTWESLFTSPVHLDSALSKLHPSKKSIVAQILPLILLRPASVAEELGIGIPPGEPWNLDFKALGRWRPASLMVERMYEMMTQGLPRGTPIEEDFPPAMIEEWKSSWGKNGAAELMRTLSEEPPLSLRARPQVGAAGLIEQLKAEKKLPVKSELSDLSPWGVRLLKYTPVLNSESYKKGLFEIQDEGSQFMSLFSIWPDEFSSFLQASPGRHAPKGAINFAELDRKKCPQVVVDACAGAGGKTLAIADCLGGKGRVYAYDTSPKKLQALARRMTHSGLNNIQTVAVKDGEERETVNRFKGSADLVLVDAPCSGWGVLRRNPDIKWRQQPDVLTRMPEIQLRLLTQYSELVAPGGRLVFGVCTFRLAETNGVVERFLENNPGFESTVGGYAGPGPSDGFFMQAFKRRG